MTARSEEECSPTIKSKSKSQTYYDLRGIDANDAIMLLTTEISRLEDEVSSLKKERDATATPGESSVDEFITSSLKKFASLIYTYRSSISLDGIKPKELMKELNKVVEAREAGYYKCKCKNALSLEADFEDLKKKFDELTEEMYHVTKVKDRLTEELDTESERCDKLIDESKGLREDLSHTDEYNKVLLQKLKTMSGSAKVIKEAVGSMIALIDDT